MTFTSYAVEAPNTIRQLHWELEWAQNGARIQSAVEGSALLSGITEDGTEVLLEGWSWGERYGGTPPGRLVHAEDSRKAVMRQAGSKPGQGVNRCATSTRPSSFGTVRSGRQTAAAGARGKRSTRPSARRWSATLG